MAQVTLWGVTYSDVPAIDLPDGNNGTVRFYENGGGSVTQDQDGFIVLPPDGGGSGGGGSTMLKMGVIRPDAELVQSWSEDELLSEDLGITIPSYTTSSTTLRSGGVAFDTTIQLDRNNYFYYCLLRSMLTPLYRPTPTSIREDYFFLAGAYELTYIDSIKSLLGSDAYNQSGFGITSVGSFGMLVFYNSSNKPCAYNGTYGFYSQAFIPAIANEVLTVKKPNLYARGSSSYMGSEAWGAVYDVRVQTKIELYRVQKNSLNIKGWVLTSQLDNIMSDVINDGTLT